MEFLNKFSIKLRITTGFALMMLIVLAISVTVLNSLTDTRSRVAQIAEAIQPALQSANLLEYHLEKANSSLGFYLLSLEDSHREHYMNALQSADAELAKLREMPVLQNDQYKTLLDEIASDVEKFGQYRDEFLRLASDNVANIPARGMAAKQVNPLNQRMMQFISGMLQSESEEEPSAKRRELLLNLSKLQYARVNISAAFRAFLAFRRDLSLNDIKLYRESSLNIIKKIEAQRELLTLDQDDSFAQYLEISKQLDQLMDKVIEVHSTDGWRRDSYLIRTEVGPLLQGISKKMEQFVGSLRESMQGSNLDLVADSEQTISFVTTFLLLGLVGGALLSFFIVRGIVTPINRAMLAMQDIAEGEGDLTQRLTVQGNDEISRLAVCFNKFAGVVQDMVQNVGKYTTQVSREAERLTVVTEETSRGADYQQQETDQVVTATTELAATVQEVAQAATRASDAAMTADNAAGNGRLVVGHTIESIDNLASEVERAAAVIDRVEKDSESIGGVLDVIKGIAEQTNLLALNAAIEAARAGEQGRGFAVVADEVRTLASRTQQSTAEIQSMIESLQLGARDAVKVMEQSRGKAVQTVDQAAKAGSSLDEINAAVAEINQLNTQIASAAHEQSAVVEEINQKVSNISGITDQTAAGAQQTASASNELNQLADQLHGLVKKFTV